MNLAKDVLGKDFWGDSNGNFNIGVRNACKLALTFDEGTGTVVNDLSGFANHGTIYPTPATFTFGRTDTGNTTQGYSANQKAGNIFTCGATGSLSKLTVRMKRNSTSGKVRLALYADSSGAPGALIAQTQETTVTTTTAWYDFPFLAGAYPSVVNGTSYWLAVLTDEAYTLRVNNTTGTINYNTDTYSDGFANPFGTPSTTASRQICIYASGSTPNPTWTTGKYGGALSLLGSSSYYVAVPAASSLSITGDVTVALWIRRTGADTGYPQLASKISNTGQVAWGIHSVTGTYQPYMVARISNVEYNTVSPNALPLNTWTFVVGVRRGTALEIWENGVMVNSNAAIPAGAMDANSTGAFRINFDAGSIAADHDELLVINRALAAEEILFMTNFVQHGCRRGIDRSKRRDKVRVKGVDAYGNIIEGVAGSGSNVTVLVKTQPSDQATLTLLAEQKLAELNSDNTGTPIILPISVGAYLKPGDSIPLHIPELAMDSIYQD